MLNDITYSGGYSNEDIAVHVAIDDPLRYDLAPDRLTFTFEISALNSYTKLYVEGFAFYLMDDGNAIYNAVFALHGSNKDIPDKSHALSGYIHTEFNPAFLFQGLRIAFYYQPNERIEVIELKHQDHG